MITGTVEPAPAATPARTVFFGVVACAFSSVIAQVTLTRELLNVTEGDEFVLGLTLSVWLLLGGLGAYLGKFLKRPVVVFTLLLALVAVLPITQVLILRYLRAGLFLRGTTVSAVALLALLPLLLAPLCVVTGAVLTVAVLSGRDTVSAYGASRVYAADTVGDIIGGLTLVAMFTFVRSSFAALFAAFALSVFAALQYARNSRGSTTVLVNAGVAAALTAVAVFALRGVDHRSVAAAYRGQHVSDIVDTRYGRIVVTENHGQHTVYLNATPVASSGVSPETEALVHCALSQLPPRPLTVLAISGALESVTGEVLKYPIERIDIVELDPLLFDVARRYGALVDSTRVLAHTGDGRVFAARARGEYDAVIVSLSPPSTIQSNRYYTKEFFNEVRRALKAGGVLSIALPEVAGYAGEDVRGMYSAVAAALRSAFRTVEIYPVGPTILVASDSALSPDAATFADTRGIETRYMCGPCLDGVVTEDRVAFVRSLMSGQSGINTDLRPTAHRFHLAHSLLRYKLDLRWLAAILGLVAVVLLFRAAPSNAAVATTGFVSMTTEFILLVMMQASGGCVYYTYTLLITVFMTGLGLGSLAAGQWIRVKQTTGTGAIKIVRNLDVAVVCVLAAVVASTLGGVWRYAPIQYALAFAAALAAGVQVPFAAAAGAQADGDTRAGKVFAADLLGSGAGAFIAALVLLPSLGVVGTLALSGAVKAVSFLRLRSV